MSKGPIKMKILKQTAHTVLVEYDRTDFDMFVRACSFFRLV